MSLVNTNWTSSLKLLNQITTTATANTVIQSKDYDWVLPVVIVLALLIVVLFGLVLLLGKRQALWFAKRRSSSCCDHKQGIELDEFESGYPLTSNDRKGNRAPFNKTLERFSQVFSTKKYDTYPACPELADFKTRYRITNEQAAQHSHTLSENETPSHPSQNEFPSSSNARCDQIVSTEHKNKTIISSDQSFENNFGENDDAWNKKANFYLNKNEESGGLNNQAFWDSDLESLESNHTEDKIISKDFNSFEQFQKSPSCACFIDRSEASHSIGQLERQFSNISAPIYSCENDDSSKLSRPLGKFETVYNLANTGDFKSDIPPFQKADSGRDSQYHDQNSSSVEELPRVYKIPIIVLPPGDKPDFGFPRYEDSTSYYNSSSLESCVSTNSGQSHRRISRANNPFHIEGVSLPRPSSAPCLFTSKSQAPSHEQENQNAFISRSTSVSHPFVSDIEDNSLHSGMKSQCISSSWSSEFFELVREAGITDSDTQRRMKEMIDDRYHFLFDKKYPELQSLYSPMQHDNPDKDYASEKKSFSKHRKFKSKIAKKRNSSLDSDGYDRLKPPRMLYSEARPPALKMSRNERRKSAPDVGNRLNNTMGINSFINSSYGINTIRDDFPDDKSCFSEPVLRRHKNVNNKRENYVETVYETPWDQKLKKYGPCHPLKLLQMSRSLPFEPQYESINRIRSTSFDKTSREDTSNSGDKDTAIYDHIHGEQKDKHVAPNSNINEPPMPHDIERTIETELPIPPSSSPPKNPNSLKHNPKPIEENEQNALPSNNNSCHEKSLDEECEELSRNNVTDFPPDTIWRRPSSTDIINTQSFDSEAFHNTRFERTTSFISSSCDTPLEHPISDDEEDDVNIDNGSRRQSFHKDVMYTHTDDDDVDSGSDEGGDDSSTRSFQRMTMPIDYDESVTISRV